VIFLAIVVISPNGLMGLWERLVDLVVGKGTSASPAKGGPLGEQTEAVPGA
jgi:hypothetical protein